MLKCIETQSKAPNSNAVYYSTNTGDAGWFGQRIATTNADGRFELDQLNDESEYMMVIQGADGGRLVLSDLGAGQMDREITLPERRDLMIAVTGDTSRLALRNGKPFVVIRQQITMQTAAGHGRSGPLGADVPLELDANGGAATYEGLIIDPQADPNSAEVEVSLGYGNDFKKTVHIEPQGDTRVTFQLPPAKLNAGEPKPEKEKESLVLTDVTIRYPYCVLETENLQPRPLSDAIAEFNRTSQESPTGAVQLPITEQETRDKITEFAAEKHVPEAVRVQLEEILTSGTLPANAFFRRFTRFDDGKEMQGVWWVRLVVETKDGPVYSVPVRSTPLFARPYTQMERQQIAADGMTLIGRVASYYETPPEPFKAESTALPEFSADAPLGRAALEIRQFRPDWTFQESVDALIRRTQDTLKEKDIAGFKALFEMTGTSETLQEFAVSELQHLAQSQIHSLKVSPVTLQDNLRTWSAWQFYKPNLPVVAFLEIEYEDSEVPPRRADAQPLAETNRKTLSLELGLVGDELRLVNYIADGEANPPQSLNPGPSISGHLEPLADGTHLITDVITNPGTLLSAHLANEEIRQRDFRQRESAAANAGSSSDDSPETDKDATEAQ